MIQPTRRLVLALAAGFPLALLPALVAPPLWLLWAAALLGTLAAALADGALAVRPRQLGLTAEIPDTLFIGERDRVRLRLQGPGGARATRVEVLCDLDEALEPQPVLPAVLSGPRAAGLEVALVPRRRGSARVRAAWLRWTGPWGLLRFVERRALGRRIAIIPNVRGVRQAALRFMNAREFMVGVKVQKHRGEGSEFDSLREYLPGLDPRALDWKSSARHRKLLLREHRAERNHQVVLALDTGYLMSEPLQDIPRLDHAINASLLLGYVALKTGDRVSLYAFDERVRHFSAPRSGPDAFMRLQQQTTELAYSRAETNFTLGLVELDRRLKRRSLVVVLTDFVDTVTAELMVENLGRLARRHLVLFTTLRDQALAATGEGAPRDLQGLNRAMVARDLLREREVVLLRLRRLGAHCIEAPPGGLSTQLVNRYLDIKRRELV
jgi:uncharacterized protein (DUF58 family)